MKSKLLIASCAAFFLLASFSAGAQTKSAAGTNPEAKLVADDNNVKGAGKNSTTREIKGETKPKTLPLQKAEPPKQMVSTDPSKDNVAELKGVEVSANTKKGIEPKNIDRPKTSTINTSKKVDPVVMPAAKIVKAGGE
jgi:hypothetical protein